MKKYCILYLLILLANSLVLAETGPIQIREKGSVGNHFDIPYPADMPDVYYDSDNHEIIIDGQGFVNYYDVEIATAASFVTVLTTQVNGSYDTIDISSLPQGHYIITIESPLGNTFEGYFDNYDD